MKRYVALYSIVFISLFILGVINAFSSGVVSRAQINPTHQQQTIDAAVNQRFVQTAQAQQATQTAQVGTGQVLTVTAAFNQTLDVAFNQALTATAAAQATVMDIQYAQYANVVATNNADWTPVIRTTNGVEMVLVPAGCFDMGSTDGNKDEQPVNRQCFDSFFWMDRYEVTNAQFAQFGGKAGHSSNWTDPNRPRESINWFEARGFCEQRGARLLTESEWEYAARGPDNLLYPWGGDFVEDNVVYSTNSDRHTWDIGSKPGSLSWVGALDMSGNVSEWVSSIYKEYPYDATDGREDKADTSSPRVSRGGSWNDNLINVRAANRRRNRPTVYGYFTGFRCASTH